MQSHHPAVTCPSVCLPEVLLSEGSVQVRVHVSNTLLHSLRVREEGLDLQSLSLDLSAVLHPQINKCHAGHFVPVSPSEDRHSPGRVKPRRVVVVVAAAIGHDWKVGAAAERCVGAADSLASRWLESFQPEPRRLAVFKSSVWGCVLT